MGAVVAAWVVTVGVAAVVVGAGCVVLALVAGDVPAAALWWVDDEQPVTVSSAAAQAANVTAVERGEKGMEILSGRVVPTRTTR